MNLAALTTADTAAALSVHGKHEEGRTGCLSAYLIMHMHLPAPSPIVVADSTHLYVDM